MLHSEHVAVELGEPLTPFHRLFQMASGIPDIRFNLGPEEARISLSQIGWACIAKLRVQAGFGELMEQRIDLAWIQRVGELAYEVSGTKQSRLCVGRRVVGVVRDRKAGQLNG